MSRLERIEWCDIWVAGANKPDVRRVLLIGDSIARSYHPFAEKALGESFAVARMATSAFVSDPAFHQQLYPLIERYKFAVVHFNNGLHGWEYDEGEYRDGLAAEVEWIMNQSPDSRIIMALSTPVWKKVPHGEVGPEMQRVRERNRIAGELASRLNLPVNDLFNLVIDHREYFSDDGVHFKDEGKEILGAQAAETILAQTR